MKKFYFAYGSNLNIDDLREYEKRKEHKKIKEYNKEDQDKLFVLKPLYQRALIVFGGPLANFLLAILIFFSIYTFAGTLYHLLDLYFWAMLISVILSWVAPGANHPGALLVGQITAPLYRTCQRVIPSIGGLDLSPIFIFLAISFLKQVLAPYSI